MAAAPKQIDPAGIVWRDPHALKPDPKNPRTHSTEQVRQVRRSIDKFGFTNPVLLRPDGTIGAGHGRQLAALLEPALDLIPTITLLGLSDDEWTAYVIADNQLAANAGWDAKLLAEQLAGLRSVGFDLSLTGFSAPALRGFLAKRGLTAPDALPEQPAPVSRAGDLWLLGEHRLLCGSSTEKAAVRRLLGDAKPNLMVTDPPYGVEYDPNWRSAATGSKVHATGKVLNDDRADWTEAWALFPGAVAYVWHGGLHAAEVQRSLEVAGFMARAQIIWVKPRLVMSRGHYHWRHEPCLFVARGEFDGESDPDAYLVDGDARTPLERVPHPAPQHDGLWYAVRKGKRADWIGGRKQDTVWEIDNSAIVNASGERDVATYHGTQKPVECMKRPIENNSEAGDAVYEPFSGSGTTIIACEITARKCFAIELSPDYVDLAVKRWQAFTGGIAVNASTGLSFDESEPPALPE